MSVVMAAKKHGVTLSEFSVQGWRWKIEMGRVFGRGGGVQ